MRTHAVGWPIEETDKDGEVHDFVRESDVDGRGQVDQKQCNIRQGPLLSSIRAR